MTTSTIDNRHATVQTNHHPVSILKMLADGGRVMARRLRLIHDVYGERRQMKNLSDDVLKDLGITRAQLNDECSRSLTDIPANRR